MILAGDVGGTKVHLALYNFTGGRLKQIDREDSLRSLMTVNLLKRLESSVAAFRLTLRRLQQIHLNTLTRIENFRRTGKGGTFSDLSAV